MAAGTPNSILSRPLNVYALPQELLDHLTVRSIQAETPNDAPVEATPRAKSDHHSNGSLRCQACPDVGFETVEEQRTHFKSDWHRYNVKARLTGRAVTADEWEGMVEGEFYDAGKVRYASELIL